VMKKITHLHDVLLWLRQPRTCQLLIMPVIHLLPSIEISFFIRGPTSTWCTVCVCSFWF
jgi:hypothetical protein